MRVYRADEILLSDVDDLPPEPDKKWTWREIVSLEPRLHTVERQIKQIKRPAKGAFCANHIWYHEFKSWMCTLVGWESSTTALRNRGAYDCAYEHLYRLLPDCRGCWCFGAEPLTEE